MLPAVAYDSHLLGLVQGRVDVHDPLHTSAVGGSVVDQPVAGVNHLGLKGEGYCKRGSWACLDIGA